MATPKQWHFRLLDWFSANQRDMPWRSNPLPYYVWVSEIMLQQTQVVTVIPYFKRFIDRFPTVESLAQAHIDDVLKLWEGLGYYSRARNLHKGANLVCDEYMTKLPNTYEELQKIPGIGPYCAAAIASIAFGVRVPVVDGNVLRVFTRFWGIFDDIRQPKVRDMLFDKLHTYISDVDASSFNQGIMELGALICTPKQPNCDVCPLQSDCFAFNSKKVTDLPVKTKQPKAPHFDIVVGLLFENDRFLIAKRPDDKMLGGLWELPGGKHEGDESFEETVCREFLEEVGLNVEVKGQLCSVKHAYSHFKISLHVFYLKRISGKESSKEGQELKWICVDEIDDLAFPTANRKVFDILRKEKETLFV